MFSHRAISIGDGEIHRITGDLPSDEHIASAVAKLGAWRRVIGFVFNHDAAQQALGSDMGRPTLASS